MFTKLAISTLALSLLAAATPSPIVSRDSGSCDTGAIQCCQQTAMVRRVLPLGGVVDFGIELMIFATGWLRRRCGGSGPCRCCYSGRQRAPRP